MPGRRWNFSAMSRGDWGVKESLSTTMEVRTLDFVARACQGRLRGGAGDIPVGRVCTDSRVAREGDLFVAIPGERFDGHDFVPEAARRRVSAALVEARWEVPAALPCPIIVTGDVRAALGKLAAVYREDFTLPIVAVTGSNGKTTTKDFLAAVLGARYDTLASEASFNNDIGVPLTLLRLEKRHGVAVLEAGTNHPGELGPLLGMIKPRYAVMTGVGHEHLEFFKDLDGVAREEGTVAEWLPPDGRLFINGDTPFLQEIESRCRAAVTRAGLGERHEWRASRVVVDDTGTRFDVSSPRAVYDGEFAIRSLGVHQVRNALLALAVGAELGVPAERARRALADCPPSKMRMHLWEWRGARILDDAYNANVDSMRAAFETFRHLDCVGRRIAVLGDMAELGEHSEAAHREVGGMAAASRVDELLVAGRWAPCLLAGAKQAGLAHGRQCATVPELAEHLKSNLRPGDLVLLKASRSSGFERVAQYLKTGF